MFASTHDLCWKPEMVVTTLGGSFVFWGVLICVFLNCLYDVRGDEAHQYNLAHLHFNRAADENSGALALPPCWRLGPSSSPHHSFTLIIFHDTVDTTDFHIFSITLIKWVNCVSFLCCYKYKNQLVTVVIYRLSIPTRAPSRKDSQGSRLLIILHYCRDTWVAGTSSADSRPLQLWKEPKGLWKKFGLLLSLFSPEIKQSTELVPMAK